MSDFTVISDGGSLGNGSAQAVGYGSYILRTRDGREATVRVELGRGVTNNEAEYRTLIAALKDLTGRIKKAGRDPEHFSVQVHSDSLLVLNQVGGLWQVKATGLRALCDEARALVSQFGDVQLVKAARADIVASLGH